MALALIVALTAVATADSPAPQQAKQYEFALPLKDIPPTVKKAEAKTNDKVEVAAESLRTPPQPIQGEAPKPDSAVASSSAAPDSANSGGGGCAGMEAESGNDYGAVNPSSGAYGCYQIMPETAADHGCSLSSPAGQDACAKKICESQGAGAWTNPQGQNPCGRL